jgi:hypothetical protein
MAMFQISDVRLDKHHGIVMDWTRRSLEQSHLKWPQ